MSKTILITGASSGIGRAVVILFSEKGWNVVASMRQPEKETELNKLTNVLVTQLDVTQPKTIFSSIERGINAFGVVDVLVNNAGQYEFGIFESTLQEDVKTQFEVNVFGVMNTVRAILPHFRQKKRERSSISVQAQAVLLFRCFHCIVPPNLRSRAFLKRFPLNCHPSALE